MADRNQNQGFDVREEMIKLLVERVVDDEYPSATMLDMVERLLRPDEVPVYAAMLMQKVREDEYPSIPMLRRLMALT